jgi:outer membrane protein assembly factor BamB
VRFSNSNLIVGFALLFASFFTSGSDQPQWGQAWNRNMVSEEHGLASSFDPATGQNIKWIAKLGTETHSTPIIANGRVFIGTNNGEPRDPKHQGDRGVLMCFDEKDGHLLWQLVSPKREEDPYHDWPNSGISSPATVEGDRVYIVNNRGEVLCLDAKGMANGNDGPFKDEGAQMTSRGTNAPSKKLEPGALDADILWLFNLTTSAGIWSHDAAHSSILINGDFLYLNTGTGVDNTHKRIRTPDAPSLVVLNKHTGQYLAREKEQIAPNIFHSTWASPSMAEVNGRKLIFFLGGNGILYAFEALPRDFKPNANGEPAKLRKVFQFDPDPGAPKENVHRYNSNRREGPSNFYGMPVFVDNRLYIAGGGDVFWGKNEAWLKCVDATQSGDVTKSAEIWSYPLQRHVLSTPAVYNGLIFIADAAKMIHCVDAKSGKPYWTHEAKGDFWASPLVADGKVYIGSRRGDFWIFKAAKEKEVLSEIDLHQPISATATAANGTIYVATMTHLYAIQSKQK